MLRSPTAHASFAPTTAAAANAADDHYHNQVHMQLVLWTVPTAFADNGAHDSLPEAGEPNLTLQWSTTRAQLSHSSPTSTDHARFLVQSSVLSGNQAGDATFQGGRMVICTLPVDTGNGKWLSLAASTAHTSHKLAVPVSTVREAVAVLDQVAVALFGVHVWSDLSPSARSSPNDKLLSTVLSWLLTDKRSPLLGGIFSVPLSALASIDMIQHLAQLETTSQLPFSAISHNPYLSMSTSSLLLHGTRLLCSTLPSTTTRTLATLWTALHLGTDRDLTRESGAWPHTPCPGSSAGQPCGRLTLVLPAAGKAMAQHVLTHSHGAWTLLSVLVPLPAHATAVPLSLMCPVIAGALNDLERECAPVHLSPWPAATADCGPSMLTADWPGTKQVGGKSGGVGGGGELDGKVKWPAGKKKAAGGVYGWGAMSDSMARQSPLLSEGARRIIEEEGDGKVVLMSGADGMSDPVPLSLVGLPDTVIAMTRWEQQMGRQVTTAPHYGIGLSTETWHLLSYQVKEKLELARNNHGVCRVSIKVPSVEGGGDMWVHGVRNETSVTVVATSDEKPMDPIALANKCASFM
ncbi:hypothetical protein BCR44DRAFT_62364 [Catenaria anguillulae PL171]|uniref:Uncharacterized protein n=1 Tax=Catenaria anguillulae PL171 TaxID=765915 RepID=A0A1Y2H7X1_9FUNG|nr:hypothetical protein BCR44DRAFT_62364 [Catenaria anguillulae PL171]